jgi:hypothetical protein
MKILSTENYLVSGVQLSANVPLEVDPAYTEVIEAMLALEGVVVVETELPKSGKPAPTAPTAPAPSIPATIEKD